MRRIVFQTVLDGFTSYGIAFQKLFHELRRRDIYPVIRAIKVRTAFGEKVPSELLSACVAGPQPDAWEVLFGPPLYLPTPDKKTLYWAAVEDYGPIIGHASEMLSKADEVAFMNRDATEYWIGSRLLPLGVDTDVFVPSAMRMTGFCNFGTAGRLAHGSERKGVALVIRAFLDEFQVEDDVRMYVKVHPDCELMDYPDARVIIQRKHLPESEVVKWLQNLTCYVSGASREGFGFWPLQAMAVGRPVIVSPYSGLDYLEVGRNCYLADTSADGGNPTVEQLRARMRQVYSDREIARRRGLIGIATAKKWSITASVDGFLEAAESLLIIRPEPILTRLRRRFTSRLRLPVSSRFKVTHCYPQPEGRSEMDQCRVDFARSTWPVSWQDRGIRNGMVAREFCDDTKRLLFVHDLVREATLDLRDSDVIVLSTGEVCFSEAVDEQIRSRISIVPAFWFTHREFPKLTNPLTLEHDILFGAFNPGVDCFVFTKQWWNEVGKPKMPDMLMGATGWDAVLGVIVRDSVNTSECYLDGHAYRVAVVPFWKDERFGMDSDRYNRQMAKRFFKQTMTEPLIELPAPIELEVKNGNLI